MAMAQHLTYAILLARDAFDCGYGCWVKKGNVMVTRVRRSEDLGGMGESFFRLLAKDAQLVVNCSTDDQAGWDFVVEDSSPLAINYSNQSRPTYRIQVKATMGDASFVSMTYSSLLSLIQYGGPAFVFLIKFGQALLPESFNFVHFDRQKAIGILESLRAREAKGQSIRLNKAKCSLRFDTQSAISNMSGSELRGYLESATGGSYIRYIEQKAKWLREVERSSNLLQADIRFEREADLQAMANCLLGFETPFRIASTLYKAPLGIRDQHPISQIDSIITTAMPVQDMLPRGVVRLRGSSYGAVYEFKATFYSTSSSLPRKFSAVRVKTAVFDLIYKYEGQVMELIPSDFLADKFTASISELRGFVRYVEEAADSALTLFELAVENDVIGNGPLSLTLEAPTIVTCEGHDLIVEVAERLFLRLSSLGLAHELMRPIDIFDLSRTGFLSHVGSEYDPPYSFEFACGSDISGLEVSATIFNFLVKLEGKTLVCFAAFFGNIRKVSEGQLYGDFVRSEYLGEIVVAESEDIEAAQEPYLESLKAKLRGRGFVVI